MADNEPAMATKQHNAELLPPTRTTSETPLYQEAWEWHGDSSFDLHSHSWSRWYSEEDEFPFEDSNNSTPREDEDDKGRFLVN